MTKWSEHIALLWGTKVSSCAPFKSVSISLSKGDQKFDEGEQELIKSPTPSPHGESWKIRGVSHEARNAAKMAAQKHKESLGSWISRRILEAAQDDLTGKKTQVARPEDVATLLQTLSQRIESKVDALGTNLDARLYQAETHIQSLEATKATQRRPWFQFVVNKL